MSAYFLSHNGLGDNMFSIGAVRFLRQYYDKIFFLCKDKYYENTRLFFGDDKNIICVPFDHKNEFKTCQDIIGPKYYQNNVDIFICGIHKNYLKSKISKKFNIYENKYEMRCSQITPQNYKFIENFYTDINLNLSIFVDFWHIPQTKESLELYESIKKYKIIFIQKKSSDGKTFDITKILEKYINDPTTILICNDENLYKNDNDIKYELCQKFVLNKIAFYVDTIINSNEIYMIDSCFLGIVLPLKLKNKLKADIIEVTLR
jgi:hypothetical protein